MNNTMVPQLKGQLTLVLRDKDTEQITHQETHENAVTTLFLWRMLTGYGFQNDTFDYDNQLGVPYSRNYDAQMRRMGISGDRIFDHPANYNIGTRYYEMGNNLQNPQWFPASGGLPDYVEMISRFGAPSSTRDIWTIFLSDVGSEGYTAVMYTCAALNQACTQTDTEVLDVYYRIQMFYSDVNSVNTHYPVISEHQYYMARMVVNNAEPAYQPTFPYEMEPHWVDVPSNDTTFYNFGGTDGRLRHQATLHDNTNFQESIDDRLFKRIYTYTLGTGDAVGTLLKSTTFGPEGDWYDFVRDPDNSNFADIQPRRSIITDYVSDSFPHMPVQPIHNHSKDAISPYLDVDYLASGTGSLTVNGDNWTDPDLPKLQRVNIVKSGDVGVSTYTVQQRAHHGLNYNYSSPYIPIPHKFGTSEVTQPAAPHGVGNHDMMEEYDELTLVTWDSTGINIHPIHQATYTIFDGDTSPSLPVTDVRQVGVDDSGDVYVACADTGLYKVIDPLGSPSVTHFNSSTHGIPSSGGTICYAVAIGYNDAVIAIFDGALSISTDGGSSWTNYTPSSTPAFDFPEITDANWSSVNFLRVDRQSPSNQLGIQYDHLDQSNNNYYRQKICWWSTDGTAYHGPRKNNVNSYDNRDRPLNRYRHFKCSRYGSFWATVEYASERQSGHVHKMVWGSNQLITTSNTNEPAYSDSVKFCTINDGDYTRYYGGITFLYDNYMTPYIIASQYDFSDNNDVAALKDKQLFNYGEIEGIGAGNPYGYWIPIFSFEKNGGHPHCFGVHNEALSDNNGTHTGDYLIGTPVHIKTIAPRYFTDAKNGAKTLFQSILWENYGWDGSTWVKDHFENVPDDASSSYHGMRKGFEQGSYTFQGISQLQIPSAAFVDNFTNQGSLKFTVYRHAAPTDVPETPETIFSVINSDGSEETLFIDRYSDTLGYQIIDSSTRIFDYSVSNTSIPTGETHDITFAFYGSNFDVFIDGAHEQNITMPYYIDWSNVDQFYIGACVTSVDTGYEDSDQSITNAMYRGRMDTIDLWNAIWSDIDEGTTNYSITVLEDFESGSLSSEWTAPTDDNLSFDVDTEYVFRGQYSGGVNIRQPDNHHGYYNPTPIATFEPSEFSGGAQPDAINFKCLEGVEHTGFAVVLRDSSGNDVCGFASNNPQWDFYGASGWTQFGDGRDYWKWLNVTFFFDWNNGTFEIHAANINDKIVASGTGTLINNSNIELFRITGYSGGTIQNGSDAQLWIDQITTIDIDKATDTADSNKSDQTGSLSSTNLIVSYDMTDSATDLVGVETKPTHTTTDDLIDGLTITFSDGGTSPSFVNTDYYTYGVVNGILKDNAISFDYKTSIYFSPVDTEFATFTDGNGNSTVPSTTRNQTEKVAWYFGDSHEDIMGYIPGILISGWRSNTDWRSSWASSRQGILGDGSFEFTVHSDEENMLVGIDTSTSVPQDYNYDVAALTPDHLRFYTDGTVHVVTNTNDQGQQTTYTYQDRFRIEQSGGDLVFSKYDSGSDSFVSFYTETGGAFGSRAWLHFNAYEASYGIYDVQINYDMEPYFMHIGDPASNTGKFDSAFTSVDYDDPSTININIDGTPATVIIDNGYPHSGTLTAPNQGEVVVNCLTGALRFNSADAGKTITGKVTVVYFQ